MEGSSPGLTSISSRGNILSGNNNNNNSLKVVILYRPVTDLENYILQYNYVLYRSRLKFEHSSFAIFIINMNIK
jgi:hypothetical protein